MPSDMGNRWHEQLLAYCVGGEVWKCVDYVVALFSPDFMVPTDEQFQNGGRSDRQEQALELVQAMALVGRHVDMPPEHVERAMEARGVWRPWSEQQTWVVRSSLCQPRRGYVGCNSSGVPELPEEWTRGPSGSGRVRAARSANKIKEIIYSCN